MSEMIEYTTATRMAAVYRTSVARIKSLIVELGDECGKLKKAFDAESGYRFDVDVYFESNHRDANAETATMIGDTMKRAAWGALIQKLGIRKLMSSKRQRELDDALSGHGGGPSYRSGWEQSEVQTLPEIDEDTIYSVLSGMVQSADEFMAEAVAEEYDFWKPSKSCAPYKRNSEFRLQAKIIRPWMVERGYGKGKYHAHYDRQSHVTALDNIFHQLDGKGIPTGYNGPLLDAIHESETGQGETEYFRFKCHKNHNLHLEFKRLDLLEKFNQIAGRNRLPNEADAA